MHFEPLYYPFPHIIIRNIYEDHELSDIMSEIDEISKFGKLNDSVNSGSYSFDKISNSYKSTSKAVVLDVLYENRRHESKILSHNRKLFNRETILAIEKISDYFGHMKFIDKDMTKLKYYGDGDTYLHHQDVSRYTFTSYFFKNPKMFTGGNLIFDKYDYEIPIEHNMGVFFIGCFEHSSSSVKILPEFSDVEFCGKYCITQFLDKA